MCFLSMAKMLHARQYINFDVLCLITTATLFGEVAHM